MGTTTKGGTWFETQDILTGAFHSSEHRDIFKYVTVASFKIPIHLSFIIILPSNSRLYNFYYRDRIVRWPRINEQRKGNKEWTDR